MSALFINLASFVNLFRKKILKINQFISIFVVIVFVFFALRSSFITMSIKFLFLKIFFSKKLLIHFK
jgi:hypothetical protein